MQQKPDVVVSRLAWDETGEPLTVPSDEVGDQKRSTWQVMVSRCRLIVVWLVPNSTPKVIDWTLVIPPVLVKALSAASIYYSLFHAPMTRPIMMARFWIMQQAVIAMDISETDDAQPNAKLEVCFGRQHN